MRGPLVSGNLIHHEGSAGVYFGDAFEGRIQGNTIMDPNWISLPASTYAGIQLEDIGSVSVSDNTVARYKHPNALKAIHITGTSSNVDLNDNRTAGYSTDLMITGAGVTFVSGKFQRGTVLSLQSGAAGPRGDFSGLGVPALPAAPGSTFRRTDGGAGSSFYVKETASSSTTWAAK
jgi:hypothetical protein